MRCGYLVGCDHELYSLYLARCLHLAQQPGDIRIELVVLQQLNRRWADAMQ